MTIIAAKHLGAEIVFAIDLVPERLAMAKQFGAIPLNPSLTDVKEEILNNTHGRGADAVMEVVGSSASLKLAIDCIHPGEPYHQWVCIQRNTSLFLPAKRMIKILFIKVAVAPPVIMLKNFCGKK